MKQLHMLAGIMLLALVAVLCGCDDKDEEPMAPELGELILSTNTCAPGQTITATAKVKTEGAHYYYFRIYYKVGNVTNTIEKADIADKKGDIKFSFIAPATAGTYTVSTHASVSFTAYDKLYGDTNSVSATLRVED